MAAGRYDFFAEPGNENKPLLGLNYPVMWGLYKSVSNITVKQYNGK